MGERATTAGLPKEGPSMLSSEVSELAADFAAIARKMDRQTRAFWANTAFRWNDWQDDHMPDQVIAARDVMVAAIINPDGAGV